MTLVAIDDSTPENGPLVFYPAVGARAISIPAR
jgi:hypothetical protein